MSAKTNNKVQNSAIVNSFKSPMFLAIAICFSVIFIAVLITTITMGLGFLASLALIFSGVSTLCAWLLYATPVTKGKIKNLRLYIGYRKVMNTFAIIFVSIFGAILVGGCIVLSLMSDMIKEEIVPMLEEEVKPMLEEMIASSEMAEDEIGDFEEAYEDMPEEIKELFGFESADDFKSFFSDFREFANNLLDSWDEFIDILETDFMMIAILVAVVYVLVIVALSFISSALKRTSKYLKAFGKNENTDRKAPYIVSFIGGGFAAIGGFACFLVSIPMAISALVTAATVILLAIFFKEMNEERAEAELAAAAEADVVAEAVEEIDAIVEEPIVEAAVAEEAVVAEDTATEE